MAAHLNRTTHSSKPAANYWGLARILHGSIATFARRWCAIVVYVHVSANVATFVRTTNYALLASIKCGSILSSAYFCPNWGERIVSLDFNLGKLYRCGHSFRVWD